MCARLQACPKESHLKAAKRILRYLKGTDNLTLFYPTGDSLKLVGYADADFVGTLLTIKAPPEWLIF